MINSKYAYYVFGDYCIEPCIPVTCKFANFSDKFILLYDGLVCQKPGKVHWCLPKVHLMVSFQQGWDLSDWCGQELQELPENMYEYERELQGNYVGKKSHFSQLKSIKKIIFFVCFLVGFIFHMYTCQKYGQGFSCTWDLWRIQPTHLLSRAGFLNF